MTCPAYETYVLECSRNLQVISLALPEWAQAQYERVLELEKELVEVRRGYAESIEARYHG